ncbi:MAG TPA: serine/threonine-protein kinase [Isosphaeraceae bacterium]|jgi:serine/threonine-protein kinase|nr:serine/threonine-protein kinase [Isosphaeraceae bacterium]
MTEAELAKPVQPEPRLGSYRLIRQLGSGGMSSVFKGIHDESGLEVAVKVLPRYLAKNPTLLQRFLREAKSAESLEHPNIVAIYDRGNDEGRYYLVLEYIAGGDLHDRVRNYGPLGIAESVRVIRASAQGLRYAAGRGVIHRDVKPANLLVTPDGHVKITDLGLALQVEADEDERVTRDGTTVGTVDYMAPEQARDSRATSVRSDIYSLGCTMYYVLTGMPPFAGGDVTEKLRRHAIEPAPDVRRLRPEVPAALSLLIRRMMAKEPEARFADYDQLIAALDALPIADSGDDDLPPLVPLDAEPDFTLGTGRSGSGLNATAGSTAEASAVFLPERPNRSSGTVPAPARPAPAPSPTRQSARATAESVEPMLRQLDERPEPGLPPPVYGSATLRTRRDPTMAYIVTGLVVGGGIALILLVSQFLWPLVAGRGPAPTPPAATSKSDDASTAETLAFPEPGEAPGTDRP